ncbi:MAG: N-acetyltransferase family protein [Albidovulum sp.]
MIIRPAEIEDVPAILRLWNPIIQTTFMTFTSEEKTARAVGEMIVVRRAAGQEFWVVEDGGVIGFAAYAQFRGGSGYAHAMEHTIILAPEARGRGTGRRVMADVEAHARTGGAHTMFACVSGENHDGVGFHERIGYKAMARIPEVGRKFGRWIDLVMMMKRL